MRWLVRAARSFRRWLAWRELNRDLDALRAHELDRRDLSRALGRPRGRWP